MRYAPIRMGAALLALAAAPSCSDDNDAALAPTSPRVEPATTPAPDPVTAAGEIAQGFADAWGANDVDRALTYLTDSSAVKVPRSSYPATSFASLGDLHRWSALGESAARGADWIVEDCTIVAHRARHGMVTRPRGSCVSITAAGHAPGGLRVRCGWSSQWEW